MFEKILIATDGSEHSVRAAKKGIDLAKLSSGTVTVVYVVDPNRALSDVSFNIADDVLEGLKQSMMVEGDKATSSVEESAKAVGVPVDKKVVEGNPAEEILKISEGMDVVVMGSVGRTGLSKFLLGSVAEKVVRNSKVPVMVVY
ncbi:universal stress protein [Methanotrichaceae archaeon M04Ac]|uniref:Universal stress protein n=1 Tax=Candidatus Methanocrinis alkalitolerans TaxID=3033395 RepID=A0ABT5XDA8_9EURY|nr:universal stress protein [Candidatus Methanocrinis alkalitolerans]MCR3884148.1 universal stress protein [Methanothrix sp.]MDF0592695.1 universal stress protein [Candidatus Methanocrinis alkalitolerans]